MPHALFSGPNAPCPDDLVIALMGMTGAGKSSFISLVLGHGAGVGHALESCTQEVETYSFIHDGPPSRRVFLIDTPGFDDDRRTDSEILRILTAWLAEASDNKIQLSGIVYLHRINQPRLQGSAKKNIRQFEKLCGEEALSKVVLATTMWDIEDEASAMSREQTLLETREFWGYMIEKGSKAYRHNNTKDSALMILNHFIKNDSSKMSLQAVEEAKDGAIMAHVEQRIALERSKIHRALDLVKSEFMDALQQKDREVAEVIAEVRREHGMQVDQLRAQNEGLQEALGKALAKLQEVFQMLETRQTDHSETGSASAMSAGHPHRASTGFSALAGSDGGHMGSGSQPAAHRTMSDGGSVHHFTASPPVTSPTGDLPGSPHSIGTYPGPGWPTPATMNPTMGADGSASIARRPAPTSRSSQSGSWIDPSLPPSATTAEPQFSLVLERQVVHRGWVTSLAFAPNGGLLASASETVVLLTTLSTGKAEKTIKYNDPVRCLDFSPDGGRLAWTLDYQDRTTPNSGFSGAFDFSLVSRASVQHDYRRVWDSRLPALAFSPDSTRVAIATTAGDVLLWNIAGQIIEQRLRVPPAAPPAGAPQPQSPYGAPAPVPVVAQQQPVIAVCFTPDGSRVIGAVGTRAAVWRFNNPSAPAALELLLEHAAPVQCVHASPSSAWLATGTLDGSVCLFDLATGRLERSLVHAGTVGAVVWAPDGARLAVAPSDRTVRVWALSGAAGAVGGAAMGSWELAQTLVCEGRVACLAFSRDGYRFAAGSQEDRMVRVWRTGSAMG